MRIKIIENFSDLLMLSSALTQFIDNQADHGDEEIPQTEAIKLARAERLLDIVNDLIVDVTIPERRAG